MAKYKYTPPNAKIRQLQQFLNTQGYGLTVDGQAGPATLAAQQHWTARQKTPPLPPARPTPMPLSPTGVLGGPMGASATGAIPIPDPISAAGVAPMGVPRSVIAPPVASRGASPMMPPRTPTPPPGVPDITADQLRNPISRLLGDRRLDRPNPRLHPKVSDFATQNEPMTTDEYPGITEALKNALAKRKLGMSLTGMQ